MNPPQLPVSRAILTLLASSLLAAPTLASPDFSAMRECNPDLHVKYEKMKGYAEGWDSAKLARLLPALSDGIDTVATKTDSLLWPMHNSGALPSGCLLDDGKIKNDVYAGLAELRRKVNEKAAPALPEEDRAHAKDLTEIEGAVDALMGNRSQTLGAFKASLSGVAGRVRAFDSADHPESFKARIKLLVARVTSIQARVEDSEKEGMTSLGGSSMPESVREKQAKDADTSKKRTGRMMGIDFGAERRDDSPSPPAGAPTPAPGAGRSDGGAPADSVKKIPRPRGADLVDRAEIGHGADPSEAAPGTAAETIKNSATKPLGGAINPPSADEATNYLARKTAAKISAESILNMKDGREKAEAEMEANEARGFAVDVSIKNGAGFLTLNKGGRGRRFEIVNGKLPNIPLGDLTPEEEGVLAAELDAATRKRTN